MLEFKTVILECPNISELATFYSQFLGWPVVFKKEAFVRIQSPASGMGIGFQFDEDYVPPVWPNQAGEQQMMIHLHFGVANKLELQESTERALQLGAGVVNE